MKANWLGRPGVHIATHRYRPVRLTTCADASVAAKAAAMAVVMAIALRSTLIALLLTGYTSPILHCRDLITASLRLVSRFRRSYPFAARTFYERRKQRDTSNSMI